MSEFILLPIDRSAPVPSLLHPPATLPLLLPSLSQLQLPDQTRPAALLSCLAEVTYVRTYTQSSYLLPTYLPT